MSIQLPKDTGPPYAAGALRESEELFAKAFWLSPDCVALVRAADDTLIKVNDALCRIWNTTPEEVIGKTFDNFSKWINEEERLGFDQTLAENGECLNYEATFRMNDGRLVTFKLSSRMLTLNGESCILNLRRDITEERRIAMALKTSELRYRRLFETAKDGILILDARTGMVMDVNPFLMDLLGFSHEQFLGKAIWELGFFKDVVANEAKFAELRMKEYVRYEGLPLEAKDGRRIEVEFVSNVYLVNEEKVIQCNIRDVTTRRRAEEAVRRQETELRVLFDLIPAMIWFKDAENGILRVNQRVAESTGMRIEDIEGKSAYEIFPSEAAAYYADDLEVIESATSKLGIIEKLRGPDDQELWVQTDKVPVLGKDGKVLGLIAMVQDVTVRMRADAALTESELRYHSLFENMVEGYAYCRLLYDEQGRANDFVYLEVNTAFESLSGLKDVAGQKISALAPGIQHSSPDLFEKYSRVASTGKTEKFETHVPALKRWFSLTVYSSKKEHFVAVFDNITVRKQAEEALRESEERFAGAFEQAPIGMSLVSPEGRWLKVNRALCLVVGYSEGELLARTVQDITDPEDLAADLENVRRMLSGEIPSYQMEKRYIHADGNFVPVLINVSLVRNGQGQPIYFIAQIQDITERKRGEARLRRLVDSNAQGVIFWNRKGEITEANDAYLNLVGYTREDLEAGRINWISLTPPEYAHLDRIALEEIAAHGASTPYEKEFIRKDGSRVPILLGAAAFEDNPDDGVCFFVDLSARKKIEEDLRESQHFAESIAENTTSVIYLFDFQTRQTLYTNRNGAEALGYSKEQIGEMGANFLPALLHPTDMPKILQQTENFTEAADGRVFDLEIRLKHAGGEWRWFWTREAIFNRHPDGTPWQIMGTAQDITERKYAEEKLSEALAQEKELSEKARAGDRAKGEFLAVMSHEIRTPLNGILGFSELLAQTPNLPEESRDYVETITSSGEALLRILDDVLDYSRLDAGHLQVEKTLFSPRDVLGDIRALLAQQARDKQLTFDVSVAESIPENLTGDAGRLRQIILNLAGNAIKFTDNGCVTLGLRPAHGLANYEFFVKDTGCGIASGQLERLFQPFTQADSSISRRHGGSGLGLSISRRLAELLGGTLTVRSQPGQGSEFILAVFLSDAASPPDGTNQGPGQKLDSDFATSHPLRIMIVEDDRVNLKLMVTLIRRLGYDPLVAKNGSEAVEIQQSRGSDCVLMDLQMPEMDGIEATEKIRTWEKSSHSGTPAFISALTANIVPEDRQRCFDAGMNSYLNKPVKLAALAAMLSQASDSITTKGLDPRQIGVT